MDRTVLITGASPGIGRATALAAGRKDHAVAVHSPMKIILAPLVGFIVLLVCPVAGQAQSGFAAPGLGDAPGEGPPPLMRPNRVALTAHVGYAFGGSVEGDGGRASLEGGPSAGAIASFTVSPGAKVRLVYSQQANELFVRNDVADTSERFDLNLRSLQIGGALELPLPQSGGRLWPHFAMTLGTTQLDPSDANYGTSWLFSGMLEGGATLWIVRQLGLTALLRLHGQVLDADNASFCTGGGSCAVVRSTRLLLEGEIGGGITLAL
jgi:hypothetical protein